MSISIYQILAEQSPAASLPIINENYRILCDEINKLEQYIDPSVQGGTLTISNLLIKKYNNPVDNVIFISEASGKFNGKLITLKTLEVGADTPNDLSIINSKLQVNNELVIQRKQDASNNTLTSKFNSGISVSDLFILNGIYTYTIDDTNQSDILNVNGNAPPTTPPTLGKNNLKLFWNNITAVDTPQVLLSAGVDGQIIIITNKGNISQNGEYLLSSNIGGVQKDILKISGILNNTDLDKIVFTLMYDAIDSRWILINYVVPSNISLSIL